MGLIIGTKITGGGYDANNTYLQRDIAVLRGRLTAGEYNTSGQQFTSVPFRGVQLSSDDRMLPESQRGYAPDIRGIARTNAKVTVKQQGRTIYETNVTPGEFVINDLYPSGYAGDLDVTIQESDGSIQQYSIPYASVAQLLRPGGYQYSVTAGKLRDSGVADEPIFYEMTYARGLNNIFTAYGGAQVSENYKAALIGTAIGTGMGAIGLDITQAQSQLEAGKKMSGQSYRINYSKLIDATNSDITLAAYRFSSSGYMDFLTAMQTRGVIKQGEDPDTIWRSKNRVTLSLNQGLASDWGNLYVSASMENYWNSDQGYNKQYQLGYSNTYKLVNYSVNISRNKSANGYDQTSLYLDFSMPLWDGPGARAPYVSVRYNRDSDGESSEQATLSGTVGENNKYNYNVSATHSDQAGDAANIGAGWTGSMATVSGGYGEGRGYRSASFGMSGGMVAHSGGLTFSPYNSDGYALIEAKDARGAKLAGYADTAIDMFGYALYPSLAPYQVNHIAIDPEGSSLNVEFENTEQNVIPRAGAIVKVKFNTNTGTPVLITSSYAGEVLPFGADVFDEDNVHVGTVTQGSVIYARVRNPQGILSVKWGDSAGTSCKVRYILMPGMENSDKQMIPQQFKTVCAI